MANLTGKGGFKPGQSGNPGGRPKELKIIQELAREHGPDAIKTLAAIMNNGKATPAARAMAANALLDRGYGKPPQFSAIASTNRRSLNEMTDEELMAIARGATPAESADDPVSEPDPSQIN
jgi:hypothetical protein